MTVLDLFSGIGGFSLGLERTGGFRTVAFCDAAPFPRKVLANRWPGIPCHDDVQTMEFPDAEVICAGFPCQDISLAGHGAGIAGSRSGLFWHVVRAIRVVRPRYVLLENVAELLGRGMGEVVGALAACGYDAEYDCIPASALGADHIRDRVWIVAYPGSLGLEVGERLLTRGQIADAAASASGGWHDRSGVGRAVHGLPNRVDRITALGNAIVPQIAELIGRAILRREANFAEAQHAA